MGRAPISAALAMIAGVALTTATTASAQRGDDTLGLKRITVDRVEAEPSVLPDLVLLRIYISAIDLETAGSVLEIAGKKSWTLQGTGLKGIPYAAGAFDGADAETAIVFVIQHTDTDPAELPKDKQDTAKLDVAGDLESIKKALREEVLPGLPGSVQVAIIGYGEGVTSNKLTSAKSADGQLDGLTLEPPTAAPAMLQAVERGVRLLKKARPSLEGAPPQALRRILVVIGDGRDADDDRDRITRLGVQADRQGIRIHAIAYSPAQRRRPMLALGELTRRSQGTFRWIPQKIGDQSFLHAFQKLTEEIRRQYVLTMFVPADAVPRKLGISTTIADRELRSRDLKLAGVACGEADACPADGYCVAARCVRRATPDGRGVFGWMLLIGGVVLGGFVVLIGGAVIVGKVREGRAPRALKPVPGTSGPPAPVVPGGQPGAAPAPAPAGAPAPAAAPGAIQPVAVGHRPSVQPCLYVLSGPLTGQRLPLHHGYLIGKAPDCHMSLAHDGFASGHHAQILMDALGNCSLVDQGSTNGTFINGVRVTESRLSDGMAIRCGSTELRFLAQ